VFANGLLAEAGIDSSKLDEGHMDQLLHMLLRARAEEKRILHAQLTGDYEGTRIKDPIFKDLALPSVPRWHGPLAKPSDAIPALTAAADRFVAEKKDTEWKRKTLLDQLRVLQWFQELTSPAVTIDKITKADVRDFVLDEEVSWWKRDCRRRFSTATRTRRRFRHGAAPPMTLPALERNHDPASRLWIRL